MHLSNSAQDRGSSATVIEITRYLYELTQELQLFNS